MIVLEQPLTPPRRPRRPQWWSMRADQPQPPGSWIEHAACRGKRMWYTTLQAHHAHLNGPDRRFEAEALLNCARCPVLLECQAWALTDPDPAVDHVAGGMTPKQRHRWRKDNP